MKDLPHYDPNALRLAARLYSATSRLQNKTTADRVPYLMLLANEVLAVLRYISGEGLKPDDFPRLILRAQDVLLSPEANGSQGWSFNPFHFRIGMRSSIPWDGPLGANPWWEYDAETAVKVSRRLNVTPDDIRNAYTHPHLAPATGNLQSASAPVTPPASVPVTAQPPVNSISPRDRDLPAAPHHLPAAPRQNDSSAPAHRASISSGHASSSSATPKRKRNEIGESARMPPTQPPPRPPNPAPASRQQGPAKAQRPVPVNQPSSASLPKRQRVGNAGADEAGNFAGIFAARPHDLAPAPRSSAAAERHLDQPTLDLAPKRQRVSNAEAGDNARMPAMRPRLSNPFPASHQPTAIPRRRNSSLTTQPPRIVNDVMGQTGSVPSVQPPPPVSSTAATAAPHKIDPPVAPRHPRPSSKTSLGLPSRKTAPPLPLPPPLPTAPPASTQSATMPIPSTSTHSVALSHERGAATNGSEPGDSERVPAVQPTPLVSSVAPRNPTSSPHRRGSPAAAQRSRIPPVKEGASSDQTNADAARIGGVLAPQSLPPQSSSIAHRQSDSFPNAGGRSIGSASQAPSGTPLKRKHVLDAAAEQQVALEDSPSSAKRRKANSQKRGTEPGQASQAIPPQDETRMTTDERGLDQFDIAEDRAAVASAGQAGNKQPSVKKFVPHRLTYPDERRGLPDDVVIVQIPIPGRSSAFDKYAVGTRSQTMMILPCQQCKKLGVECFPGFAHCVLCELRGELCWMLGPLEGETPRETAADGAETSAETERAQRPAPPPKDTPRPIKKNENVSKFPEDYEVGTLKLPGKPRYLLGKKSSPRRETPCTVCRAAGFPCFKDGGKKKCVLCSLRKASCVPVSGSGKVTSARPLDEIELPHIDEEVIVARVGQHKKKGGHREKPKKERKYQWYAVGLYGSKTNKVECVTCHYAVTRDGSPCPCLHGGNKRKGCMLCAARRMPCIPYKPRSRPRIEASVPATAQTAPDPSSSQQPVETPVSPVSFYYDPFAYPDDGMIVDGVIESSVEVIAPAPTRSSEQQGINMPDVSSAGVELKEEQLAALKAEIKAAVRAEVREEVCEEVREGVREGVRAELRAEVREEVRAEVREEVRAEVRAEEETKATARLHQGVVQPITELIVSYHYDCMQV
ncbi:hypothetical protein FA95DRAFT_1285592 [Auriscalpium vulgare]|uniref:Uncharacterized protein n=1 Tax=Auriscalpium vulgare TaxID=40419 RepID=A0ACB8RS41_9AGAM|nr:hypothetical protein FA95DRAFT_1285592 [Auriscalpium vulgare]